MGLDVRGYSKTVWVREYDDDCGNRETDAVVNQDFPERADGLKEGIYSFEDEYHFRAGSYIWYSVWREWLASVFDMTPEQVWGGADTPAFKELIWFSDCEGVIGPVTSRKLVDDFAKWRDAAAAKAAEAEANAIGLKGAYMRGYDNFATVFSLAADGGFVRFS